MKKLIQTLTLVLGALVGLSPLPVSAQVSFDQNTATLFYNYDPTSTPAYTYGGFSNTTATGTGNPAIVDLLEKDGIPFPQGASVTTAVGGSTTITATTAGTKPFLRPNVGDLLIFTLPFNKVNAIAGIVGKRVERVIVTNADDDTVTVDTSIDLSAAPVGVRGQYKKFVSGTAVTDGWFPVSGAKRLAVFLQVNTLNATSLDFVVDCKLEGGLPAQSAAQAVGAATYPTNTVAVTPSVVGGGGVYALFAVGGADYCRVGWRVTTDTGVNSVSTFVTMTR